MNGMIHDEALMKIFFEEANDLVERMDRAVNGLRWEGNDRLPLNSSVPFPCGDLRRYAHTLKGSSRAVGYEELGSLMQALEHFFAAAGKEETPVTGSILELLADIVEACRDLLEGREVPYCRILIEKIKRVTGM